MREMFLNKLSTLYLFIINAIINNLFLPLFIISGTCINGKEGDEC